MSWFPRRSPCKFSSFAPCEFLHIILISYLFHSCFQEIKGLKEGEDPEDGEATEEGVTFNLWKKTEQPPPVEPVYDEVRHTHCPCHPGGALYLTVYTTSVSVEIRISNLRRETYIQQNNCRRGGEFCLVRGFSPRVDIDCGNCVHEGTLSFHLF